MIEPILLGLSQVADLDEGDVVEVALVVDVLQLLEDVLVLLVGLVVCSDATKVNLSPSNEHNASNFQLPTSNLQKRAARLGILVTSMSSISSVTSSISSLLS